VSGIFLAGNLGTLDGEFGAFERLLRTRASDFFVVRIGGEPQRITNQVHDVKLSALFRVIE
jgi:hypothetical protein